MNIELDSPNLGVLEKKYLCECIDSNYVSTVGPFVPKFEKTFAKYLHVEHTVSLQSGTAALHMALVELGITTGDEVILPSLTFVATANPIRYVGATPVFVDVDPITWNISPKEIEKAITSKTKAIIPVHLYGNPCDMSVIMEIAEKHQLFVIEDATESLGAKYNNIYTGTIGDIGCFSFNGNKLITTGGGGMVVAKSKDHANHIRFLANQARDVSKGYYHTEIGYNMRMTNLEASLGLAQMERLNGFIEKKQKFNTIYRDILDEIPFIKFQNENINAISAWWLSSLTIEHPKMDIPSIQRELQLKKIPSRRLFSPINKFPPYHQYNGPKKFPVSEFLYEYGLNLPSSTVNNDDDIRYIAETIKEICSDV